MKGLNFKSNLKPVPNSFMSADEWGEEVRRQQKREKRTDYRLHLIDYPPIQNIDLKHTENLIKIDYLLWGEESDETR